jgi:hypothetical protein
VSGYAVATADGRWSVARHFGDPAVPGAPPVAAVKDAVFHAAASGETTIARRSALDPSVAAVDNGPLTRPVTSDPARDLLVLADAQGCQQLVRSAPRWTLTWLTCTWDLRALHGDGVHAVGLSSEHGWGVVDLRSSEPVLLLGGDSQVQEDSFRFDRSGQLNLVVRSDVGENAIATCTLEGRCWLAAPWSTTPYVLVQPNDS